MRRDLILVLALMLLPSGAALAEDTGFYAGGDVGNSTEHFNGSTFGVNADNGGYKVAVGLRPLPVLAAELDYVGFGRASAGVNFADTYGVSASALAFLPLPIVDVYGRLGVMEWRTDANSPGFSFHRTGSDLTYGVGAGAHWGAFAARLEYERFQVAGASTMQLATAGITYTIGWPF
ncbi:MAG TPA: outer membrane beta-barrel protein [Steroidobacteraceae bacterium]|jgi:hypothetical protein|nr:outer membrane beta-barrel protein [Steroidobacteraceae bacterium]